MGWVCGSQVEGYAAHVIDAAKKNKCAVMRIQMRELNGNCSALFGHFCLASEVPRPVSVHAYAMPDAR